MRGIECDKSLINRGADTAGRGIPDEPRLPSQTPSLVLTNGTVRPTRKDFWPRVHSRTRKYIIDRALHLFTTTQTSWNKRDLLTYAIGIGAKTSEKQFVYGNVPPSFVFYLSQFLPHFRTWYVPSFVLVRRALNSALRPIVCCFPHISSRPRLQRYDGPAIFTETLTSISFYRDRPRRHKLCRAHRRDQYLQGSPHI